MMQHLQLVSNIARSFQQPKHAIRSKEADKYLDTNQLFSIKWSALLLMRATSSEKFRLQRLVKSYKHQLLVKKHRPVLKLASRNPLVDCKGEIMGRETHEPT